ncbi:MAG: hypothetical protein AAF335_00780 [Bacteroidota bacterium]
MTIETKPLHQRILLIVAAFLLPVTLQGSTQEQIIQIIQAVTSMTLKDPNKAEKLAHTLRSYAEQTKNWVQSKIPTLKYKAFSSYLQDTEEVIHWLVLGSKSETKEAIVPAKKIIITEEQSTKILDSAQMASSILDEITGDKRQSKARKGYQDFHAVKVLMAVWEVYPKLRESTLKKLLHHNEYSYSSTNSSINILHYLTIDKNGPQLSLKGEITYLQLRDMIDFLRVFRSDRETLAIEADSDYNRQKEDKLKKKEKLLKEKIFVDPQKLTELKNYVLPKKDDGSLDWEQIQWEEIRYFSLLPMISDGYDQYMHIPITEALAKMKDPNCEKRHRRLIRRLIRASKTNFLEALRTAFPQVTVTRSKKSLKIDWKDEDFSQTHCENVRQLIKNAILLSREEVMKAILPDLVFGDDIYYSKEFKDVKWDEVKWNTLADLAKDLKFCRADKEIIAKQVFPHIRFNNTTDTRNVAWKEITHFKAANWLIEEGIIEKEALSEVPVSLVTEKLSNATEGTPEVIFWKHVRSAKYSTYFGTWALATAITMVTVAWIFLLLVKNKKPTYKTEKLKNLSSHPTK